MRDFKTFTSKAILKQVAEGNNNRKKWIMEMFAKEATTIKRNDYNKVWQDGNHPILLDTNNILDTRLHYLHSNPIEQGIVSNAIDYIYSSASDYAGDKGLLDLLLIE